MAYLDTRRTQVSKQTLILVAAIEAAVVVALVNGLAVNFRKPDPGPPLIGEQIRLPEIPKPEPKIPPKPDERIVRQPETPTFVPPPQGGLGLGAAPAGSGPYAAPSPSPDPEPLIELPKQPPQPTFAPRLARAKGNPGLWATTSDYPARDLREGNQGTVRFSLAIGADGKVDSCIVTVSSGFAGLDAATCSNISRRARFEPATDASGTKVAGTYSGSIRWVIPD